MMTSNRYDDGKWLWIYEISCLDQKEETIFHKFHQEEGPLKSHGGTREIDEMQGQYLGAIRSWKGTVASGNKQIYMV